MTVLDIKLVPRVKSIIDKYGKLATFLEQGWTRYDETTGDVTTSGSIRHQRKVVPPSPASNYLEGNTVAGQLVTFVAAQGLEFEIVPLMTMAFGFDTRTEELWTIESVDRIYTGEAIALCQLTLKKGGVR